MKNINQNPSIYKDVLDKHGIIAVTDAHGKIIHVNDNFCDISGYSREELLGQDHRIVNSGYHDKEFFEEMWSTIKSGKPWKGEIKNRKKGGDFYWVEATILPLLDENNELYRFFTFRTVITKLKRDEILSKEIQSLSKIGGWEIDISSMSAIWSEEVYKIHDVDLNDQYSVENAINFYVPEDRERISKYVSDALEEHKPFNDTFQIISKIGVSKHVRTIGKPIIDPDGRLIKIVGTFQDITEQVQRENELRESKTYLELALEGSGLGVWDWYLEDNSVRFDKRWCSMLGFDVQSVSMELKTWEERVHPEDLADCYKDIQAYLNGETEYYENIHRMKHANGKWVYILDRGRISDWDKDGKPVRFTGTHLDITDSVSAQQVKLDEMTQIVSSTPSCLKIIDDEGKLLDMNRQGLDLIGAVDLPQVFEANVYDIVEESHRENFKDFNERVCSGENGSLVFEIISLDGTRRWMETYAAPYKLPNGKTAHIAITNDISDKVKYEQELEEQKKLAQHSARLASIGELAAGVGHEINNPLAIAKGYLGILEDSLESRAEKEMISKSLSALDRIESITNGLRTFSRMDFSDTKPFSPHKAVNDSIDLIKGIYKTDGIEFENNIKEQEDVFIKGNLGNFQQVLMNLISNSKDAMNGQSSKLIKITSSHNKDVFKLVVEDAGCGMSQAIIDKIYNPFFTTKDVGKGTGIGMSLVSNFIKDMGGNIDIDSVEGSGTKISISIPRCEESPVLRSKSNIDKADLNLRLLIIEVESGIRDVL
jgi:PAS domain S-box-containing protein